MPKFKIAVEWAVCDEIEVEAASLEQAKQEAFAAPLTNGSYIEGSFQINEEVTDELNLED